MTRKSNQPHKGWKSAARATLQSVKMTKPTKEQFSVRAEALGVAALKRGRVRAPALDRDMMDLMREANPSGLVGNPLTLNVLKAWLSGWDREALNQGDTQ